MMTSILTRQQTRSSTSTTIQHDHDRQAHPWGNHGTRFGLDINQSTSEGVFTGNAALPNGLQLSNLQNGIGGNRRPKSRQRGQGPHRDPPRRLDSPHQQKDPWLSPGHIWNGIVMRSYTGVATWVPKRSVETTNYCSAIKHAQCPTTTTFHRQ